MINIEEEKTSLKDKNTLYLGCVADDFTGASDAASFLVKEGIKTYLFNGIPKKDIKLDCNAIIIALKTRNQDAKEAVKETLEAFQWLEKKGAKQFYFKYCSTFDSTPKGNIGPVIDAVMEAYDIPYTVLCPSLLANDRRVKNGELLVKGVPLDQSPMKNHPLTPMWSSKIEELMKDQGKYQSIQISAEDLEGDSSEIDEKIHGTMNKGKGYLIPDFYEEKHGARIVELFGDLRLLTGGSGLLSHLGKRFVKNSGVLQNQNRETGTKGKGILLAGSCSTATLRQIAEYESRGHQCYKVDPLKVLNGEQNVEKIWEDITRLKEDDILIYSSDDVENVRKAQKAGKEKVAEKLETTMKELAVKAMGHHYKRIVVAGGETSGAVTQGLGYTTYQVGESIAPGVPILIPLNQPEVRLVLKSGNFGQKDFFVKAMEMTKKD
ncbi:MAG TPA: four-carbon acid sugar kinase family protein [Candidatus Merdenecus merdavium]|nr:four-carbon acid sugar kinase family protein [Candidatus Merdenecus merdavium]